MLPEELAVGTAAGGFVRDGSAAGRVRVGGAREAAAVPSLGREVGTF